MGIVSLFNLQAAVKQTALDLPTDITCNVEALGRLGVMNQFYDSARNIRHGNSIVSEKLVKRYLELVSKRNEKCAVGIGFARFPLGYCLRRYAKLCGKLLLCQILVKAQSFDITR